MTALPTALSMFDLSGRLALVTGASTGSGGDSLARNLRSQNEEHVGALETEFAGRPLPTRQAVRRL